ncbi:shikimate dehydrogenase [Kushneria phosphatilytica]|uniref:Shikimate dehydrogenase (NADP(+)) n=1 Tax=Kushneria phosphatilytica TaxID=657387 RepID=A0A1S1NLY1_9GAMM|nr:shikimate dehydrogenase [Kushneria phosphatilytica]OHV07776.1 shikimate dehydrogenase [Kushneria phosphatilytica]QEL10281.1 shikimate dehydrogenase [Kushneria phosphatilytica]
MNLPTDLYAVFGNPVKHSLSPDIHQIFAEQLGETLHYEARLAPVDNFAGAWRDFIDAGGSGANVTLPFKQEALALADTLGVRARRAGAINTLMLGRRGEVFGDNTDGVGLIRDLQRARAPLAGARVLVLGAGGAVRGVVEPLLNEGPDQLVIANRTEAKAVELAEDFSDLGSVSGIALSAISGKFDLVINATSASLAGDLPPLPDDLFNEGALAYDMMYSVDPTVFLQWTRARGVRGTDGLGMLVEQAAESFFLWRQRRPLTAPVLMALRARLISRR